MTTDYPEEPDPRPARPPFETLMLRALRLTCPRCGLEGMFRTYFRMHKHCPACRFQFDRGPGYFLGSTYINYGITAGMMTAMFLIGKIVFRVSSRTLVWPMFAFCIVFPVLIFRHARALWLALDCHFDTSVLDDEDIS